MKWVKTFENYSKRRMVPFTDKKILKDMADIFIELTDKGFVRNTFIGTIGESKLRDHKTETLYVCIAKPRDLAKWRRGLENEELYDISLEDTGETEVSFFDSTYFDDTLEHFNKEEVDEYSLMLFDYMKTIWGEDIEIDLPNAKEIDKYYIRIKKRP